MEKIDEIIEIVKAELASSSHDIEHTFRVRKTALKIAEHTENVNTTVVELACILHDIARVREDTDKTHSIDHAILGAEMAKSILKQFDYPDAVIEAVSHCISSHRYRGDNQPKTMEAKILSDADKLDAIGAIGVGRAFMIAGEYGEPLYKPFEKDDETHKDHNSPKNGRIKNFHDHSPNIEYEVKLKKIPERLFTDFAKKMAEERIKFMDNFFAKLQREVEGEE
ncbi:MAG: HD domain-containing protein [Caldisericaceae bacterium]